MVVRVNNIATSFSKTFHSMALVISNPWLLVGDFNTVMELDETTATGHHVASKCSIFWQWINRPALMDLGFMGTKFTWWRGLAVNGCRVARSCIM